MILSPIQQQYGTRPLVESTINEAKARIEHPEDLIFTAGAAGAKSAVNSLLAAATTPKYTTIKLDGSPAAIAGYWDGKFVLTDKSGFAKYNAGGLPTSAEQVQAMIFNRRPDDAGRKEYSAQFAKLFTMVQRLLPANFKGFIQFDVMWFDRPILKNHKYEFQPNKVLYSVPEKSELGQQIATSQVGIAIHSYFKSPAVNEPTAINDPRQLKLRPSPGLVVLGTKMPIEKTVPAATKPCLQLIQNIDQQSAVIDGFLSTTALKLNKISNLGDLMKSYLAALARQGKPINAQIAANFLKHVQTVTTDQKYAAIYKYIKDNYAAYQLVWKIAAMTALIKTSIKKQLDKAVGTQMQATIMGSSGHEGFVSDTPSGRIKLVDRPVFMRQTQ